MTLQMRVHRTQNGLQGSLDNIAAAAHAAMPCVVEAELHISHCVGAGTRAQSAGRGAQIEVVDLSDAHAHLNPDDVVMPDDSEDDDEMSVEVSSESEDESEEEMSTPSTR